jgi:predicted GTPase
MPYGDLTKQAVQRFGSYEDLDQQDDIENARIPHLVMAWLFCGVDYTHPARSKKSRYCAVDGGNNDPPSSRPVFRDRTMRPGHEQSYHPAKPTAPGRRGGDQQIDLATPEGPGSRQHPQLNLNARAIDAASPTFVSDSNGVRGKKVLVIEDGPTLTHGGMTYGAGVVAAHKLGAAELIDPRPYAVRSIADTFKKYPQTGALLPAMGYGDAQRADLEETIRKTPADVVIVATPIDLSRVIKLDKPFRRVRYELQELGSPTVADVLREKFGPKS